MKKNPAPPTTPVETELKFQMAATDLATLESLPWLAGLPCSRKRLVSIYFDTDDFAVARAGRSLRLRLSEDGVVQTLKRQSKRSTGLFVRSEHEVRLGPVAPGSEPAPDVDEIRRHVPAALFRELDGRLGPAFRVDVLRTEWKVPFGDSRISLSYDDGAIAAASVREPVHEVELELDHGRVEAVFEAARTIAAAVPLRLETASKSDRGYRLVGGSELRPKNPLVQLDKGATVAEGFEALAAGCIHQFATQEALFLGSGAPEQLHQMRVAIRRFRSLVGFSAMLLTPQEARAIDLGVRRVFRRLGTLRDLDVVLDAIDERAADEARLATLAALRAERAATCARIASMLRSRRFCARMLDLVAFIECGEWRRRGADPLDEVASGILKRQWKKLAAADRLSELDAEARHKVRIHAKKLRYACEFYGSLFPGDKRKLRFVALLRAVGALQDELGRLNDYRAIGNLLLERFGAEGARFIPEEWRGPGFEAKALAAADAAQKRLMRQDPFWS